MEELVLRENIFEASIPLGMRYVSPLGRAVPQLGHLEQTRDALGWLLLKQTVAVILEQLQEQVQLVHVQPLHTVRTIGEDLIHRVYLQKEFVWICRTLIVVT